jgi:lipoprotein LpqH
VKRGFVVAVGGAAIVIAGLSGCGSGEKKSETSGETSSAASAQGKTTVTIDGQDQ